MGDGTFAPNAEISRQDMCTMLKNVADNKSIMLDKQYDLSDFTDSDEIADYAKEAINLFKEAGVIDGYENGAFGPRDAVTRAAAAKVIAILIG
jgi:endo-1,4-beta-xylanase